MKIKFLLFAKVLVFLLVLLILNIVFSMDTHYCSKAESAGPIQKGENLYQANCAGCHANGQNLITPDKPVIGSPKLKSKALFKALLENPPKPMPSFKNITEKEEKLNALYKYTISIMGK